MPCGRLACWRSRLCGCSWSGGELDVPLSPLPQNQAVTQVLASTAKGVAHQPPRTERDPLSRAFRVHFRRVSIQLVWLPEIAFAQVKGACAGPPSDQFRAAQIFAPPRPDAHDIDQRVPRNTLEIPGSSFVPGAVPGDAPGGVSPARNERARRFLNRVSQVRFLPGALCSKQVPATLARSPRGE